MMQKNRQIKAAKGKNTGETGVPANSSAPDEDLQSPSEFQENQKTAMHIVQSSPDMIIAVDLDRRIIEFNRAAEEAFGYTRDEVLGKPVDMLYAKPGDGLLVSESVLLKGEFSREFTNKRSDGQIFNTYISASQLHDDKGRLIGAVCVSHDLADFRMAGEALKQSDRFLNTIFDSIKDPFSIIGRDYRIIRANEAYAHIGNRRVNDILGKKCHKVFYDRSDVCPDCVVKKTFHSADPCAKDKRLSLPDGNEIWVEIYTYPILDEQGNVSHVIEYTRDITGRKKSDHERKRLIKKLQYLSSTDVLTGLLNRRALLDRLNYEADRARRYGSALSLILCDIDYFKQVNDEFGHAAGDGVLLALSETLRSSLRRTDILGRYGGDEFMLILPGTSLEGARDFAERIRLSVEKREVLSGEKIIPVFLSLGVTSFDKLSEDFNINAMIRRADSALYEAKRSGRNRVAVLSGA